MCQAETEMVSKLGPGSINTYKDALTGPQECVGGTSTSATSTSGENTHVRKISTTSRTDVVSQKYPMRRSQPLSGIYRAGRVNNSKAAIRAEKTLNIQ